MILVLHPEQAEQIKALSADLELTPEEVAAMLLSGPLMTLQEM